MSDTQKKGSIVKGIVLAQAVAINASKYHGRTWRIVDLIEEFTVDTPYARRDFNYATIRDIAHALNINVKQFSKKRVVNV